MINQATPTILSIWLQCATDTCSAINAKNAQTSWQKAPETEYENRLAKKSETIQLDVDVFN